MRAWTSRFHSRMRNFLVSPLVYIRPSFSTPTSVDILDIDIQAAQLISDADDKLATFKHLAQNFPRYAGALARRVTISPDVLEEIAENQPRARAGVNLVWLNGIALEEKDLTPFGYVSVFNPPRTPSRLLDPIFGSPLTLVL